MLTGIRHTQFIGKKILYLPNCSSTNSKLMRLGKEKNLPTGTVLITSHQTQGRGQQGNVWISEKEKNFTFSILLRPDVNVNEQCVISMATALGISDYLNSFHQSYIKWPNDVVVKKKKISGILIENNVSGDKIRMCVVGVGLNMNQQNFTISHATSLSLCTGRTFVLEDELVVLLDTLEKRFLEIPNSQHTLRDEFVERLWCINIKKTFRTAEKLFSGYIRGVDTMGRLIVETKNKKKLFSQKEFEWVWDE